MKILKGFIIVFASLVMITLHRLMVLILTSCRVLTALLMQLILRAIRIRQLLISLGIRCRIVAVRIYEPRIA